MQSKNDHLARTSSVISPGSADPSGVGFSTERLVQENLTQNDGDALRDSPEGFALSEAGRTGSWMADHGSLPPVLHRQDRKASDSQCVFNMVNANLAIGLLGFPYCFKSCGIVLTAVLIVVSYAINDFSTSTLLVLAHATGRASYEDLAHHAFGAAGRAFVLIALFLLNLGYLVAYVNILADVLSSVAGSIIPPGAEPSRNLLLMSVCIMAVFPVSMAVRSSDLMATVSTASVSFIMLFTAVVTVLAFAPISNAKPLVFWQSEGVALSVPIVLCAFTSHTVLFSVYSTMRHPSVAKMQRVVEKSLTTCGSIYTVVGIGGYCAFRQRTAGDVLRNLGGSTVIGLRALYERALRLGYGLSVLGCVPVVMLPLQHTLLPLLLPAAARLPYGPWLVAPAGTYRHGSASYHGAGKSHREPDPASNPDGMDISSPLAMVVTVFLCLLSMVCAMVIPNVELILGLMGSTAAVGAAMVLPGCVALRLTSRSSKTQQRLREQMEELNLGWSSTRRKAVAMVIGGLLLSFFSTRELLRAVREEAEVVQLAQQLHAKEALLLQAAEVEQKAKSVASAVGSVEHAAEALESIGSSRDSWEKSIDSVSKSLDETDAMLSESSNRDEVAAEVDEQLEAVEDLVENVTHLQDLNPVDQSEAALGLSGAGHGSVPQAPGKDPHQGRPKGASPAKPAGSAEDDALVGHWPSTRGELQSPGGRSADAPAASPEEGAAAGASAHKRRGDGRGSSHRGSAVVSKVTTKLDQAIEALVIANMPGNQSVNGTAAQGGAGGSSQAVVDSALNATIDATMALNHTVDILKEVTAAEVRAVVDRVQSLVDQLEILESSSDSEAPAPTSAAGSGGGGGLTRLRNKEAREQLKQAVIGAAEAWQGQSGSLSVSQAVAKAVQAAEAATAAALWEIKSSVLRVDPRVASRAEEIAQEMTILAAIDNMAAESRKEAERAELGMVVEEAPSAKAAVPGNATGAPSVPAAAAAGLGRKGGKGAEQAPDGGARTGDPPLGAPDAPGPRNDDAATGQPTERQRTRRKHKKRKEGGEGGEHTASSPPSSTADHKGG